MVEAGLSHEEAMSRFVVCTSVGALGKADGAHGDPNASRGLSDERTTWVNEAVSDGASMLEVVHKFKPTCLLGLAAQPGGLFTEDIVRAMTEYAPAPVVMPMSNPTAKAECTPEQAYEWTNGTAIVATGSPFDPVTLNGKVFVPSQCNNVRSAHGPKPWPWGALAILGGGRLPFAATTGPDVCPPGGVAIRAGGEEVVRGALTRSGCAPSHAQAARPHTLRLRARVCACRCTSSRGLASPRPLPACARSPTRCCTPHRWPASTR